MPPTGIVIVSVLTAVTAPVMAWFLFGANKWNGQQWFAFVMLSAFLCSMIGIWFQSKAEQRQRDKQTSECCCADWRR